MQTNNDEKYEYDVSIDFDEASKLWKQNKKRGNNGTYKYICACITKKGITCNKSTWKGEDVCWIHRKIKCI